MRRDPYTTNDLRVIPWLLFGLLVLFGGLYVAGYVLSGDRVPRGATVAGVKIGGLTPANARAELADAIDAQRRDSVRVQALGERGRIDPGRAGLDVDVAGSVEQAGGGRSWNPASIWASLTGGEDYDVVLFVDDRAMNAELHAFGRKVDRPARDGGVRFTEDQAVPRQPRTGQAVDRESSAPLVQDAYRDAMRDPDTPRVELPTILQEPDIGTAEVSVAMDQFANPAVSGPVTIELGDEKLLLRPEDYLPALSMVVEDGDLVPRLDDEALLATVEPRMEAVSTAAQDATVELRDGRPYVVHAEKGVSFNEEEVTSGFLQVVADGAGSRTMRVSGVVAKPEFSTRDARKLEIKEVVSEFTTHYPHAEYRNANLGRAAELVNGTLLKPGEEFSLNDVVGERTEENGFTEGFVIGDGVFTDDLGGEVSQVATTTFNAMFFAGLADVEHQPHSFFIDRYPVGREATVAWPSVDLRFQNDTPYGILVEAFSTPSTPARSGAMTVRMWSTKYWDIKASRSDRYNETVASTRLLEGDDCVPAPGDGGFDVDVFRSFFKPGDDELVKRETFHTTYPPSDTVICAGS